MGMNEERRINLDPRVDALIADVASIKGELSVNTNITAQNNVVIGEVRDVLTSFRVFGKVCKWLTVIAVFVTSLIALVKGVISFHDFKEAITPR